jgi:hypothetical protein
MEWSDHQRAEGIRRVGPFEVMEPSADRTKALDFLGRLKDTGDPDAVVVAKQAREIVSAETLAGAVARHV